jgi:predicted RNase H-like HicB family nuclease
MNKCGKHIILEIEKLPEGYYLATSNDVQGLVAQAKTFEKVVEIAKDIAKKILAEQNCKVSHFQESERIFYPTVI